MSKKDFLNLLKQSLSGEVNHDIIEQNIKYYDQYISSQNGRERDVIETLGDPRLIARTIIESNKIAKQKGVYSGYQAHSSDYNEQTRNSNDAQKKQGSGIFKLFNIKWYHKVIFFLIIIMFFWFVVTIGKILFSFIYAFAVPLILLMLVYMLFRKRS